MFVLFLDVTAWFGFIPLERRSGYNNNQSFGFESLWNQYLSCVLGPSQLRGRGHSAR